MFEGVTQIPIDWSRLGEPQADQYDTTVFLKIASSTTSAVRPEPYRRTPVGDSPSTFDGQVAIRHVYKALPESGFLEAYYLDGPADHPNLAIAAEYVRTWPAAFAQCQRLLEAIHPALDPRIPLESNEIYRGSSCHSYGRLFGTMWATIFCPFGLAEAIVHEMAHQKLRVLGIEFESATCLVGNDPSERYDSPIVKDRLRPMMAVLHGEYSYVHVTALDIHILKAERDSARREVICNVLERNLSRIKEGYETLEMHFRPGEHGREFMQGFLGWTKRTIDEAEELLGRGTRQAEPAPVSRAASHASPPPAAAPVTPADLLAARAPAVLAFNGGIGDRLCNLPALRALEALYPGRLSLVCSQGDRQLYYSDLNLRGLYELEFRHTDTGFTFDVEPLARHISSCDLLLSINPWHTSSVSELLARFPKVASVGFFPEFRRQLQCDYEGHAMDMAFAVPAFLKSTLQLVDFSQPPSIAPAASAKAQEFKRRYAGSQRTLFVHTDTRAEKSWPRDRFERVLAGFLHEFPHFTALVVDLRGDGIGRGQFTDRVLPVNLPLDACFALLRDCDLFLGIDSCHLHAADLFRIPGVGLFGPSTARRWGFKFSIHRNFQGAGRMDTIEVDEVFKALCILARTVRPR
jgi:ADP-heptose:LPS heptosyltransferase